MAAHSAGAPVLEVEIFHITYSGFASLFHALFFGFFGEMFTTFISYMPEEHQYFRVMLLRPSSVIRGIDITVNAITENNVMASNKPVIFLIDFIKLTHLKSIKIKSGTERQQTNKQKRI